MSLSVDGKLLACGSLGRGQMEETQAPRCFNTRRVTKDGFNKYKSCTTSLIMIVFFLETVVISGDGTVLVVCSVFNDGNRDSSGHVRVFRFLCSTEECPPIGPNIKGENPGADSDELRFSRSIVPDS